MKGWGLLHSCAMFVLWGRQRGVREAEMCRHEVCAYRLPSSARYSCSHHFRRGRDYHKVSALPRSVQQRATQNHPTAPRYTSRSTTRIKAKAHLTVPYAPCDTQALGSSAVCNGKNIHRCRRKQNSEKFNGFTVSEKCSCFQGGNSRDFAVRS